MRSFASSCIENHTDNSAEMSSRLLQTQTENILAFNLFTNSSIHFQTNIWAERDKQNVRLS